MAMLEESDRMSGQPTGSASSPMGFEASTTHNHEVDLFVHRQGARPKAVRVSLQQSLESAMKQGGATVEHGMFVFVGESEHSLAEPQEVEDGEDVHEAVAPAQAVALAGLHNGGHVHCHRCHRVVVSVHYEAHTKRHRFSPATTVATATEWAKRKFKLTDTDAQHYVLQIHDSTQQPRPDEHLGELVHGHDCELCFDVVPDQTKING
jgi:hypothetical protein